MKKWHSWFSYEYYQHKRKALMTKRSRHKIRIHSLAPVLFMTDHKLESDQQKQECSGDIPTDFALGAHSSYTANVGKSFQTSFGITCNNHYPFHLYGIFYKDIK